MAFEAPPTTDSLVVTNESELAWRKSTHSNNEGGECVEAAFLAGLVLVRDSKDPAGPRLAMSRDSWAALLRGCRVS